MIKRRNRFNTLNRRVNERRLERPIRRQKVFRSEFLEERNKHLNYRNNRENNLYAYEKRERRLTNFNPNESLKKNMQSYETVLTFGTFTHIDVAYSMYEKKAKKYLMKGKNILIESPNSGLLLVAYDRKEEELFYYEASGVANRKGGVEINLRSEIVFSIEDILDYTDYHDYELSDDPKYPEMLDKLFYTLIDNLWR